MKKQHVIQLMLIFALLLSLSAVAAAQDEEATEATPFIGVRFSATDDGVMVDAVVEDSPAEEAGLEEGDLITAIDGESVTADNIRDLLGSYAVGDEVALSLVRDDEPMDVSLTLVEFPEELLSTRSMPRGMELDIPFAEGLLSLSMDKDSIVIEELDADSPLAEAGFEAGDRIIAINGVEIAELRSNLEELLQADTVTVTVERGDETIEMDIEGGVLPMFIMPGQGSEFGEFFGHGMDRDGRFEFEPNMPFRGNNRVLLGVQFVVLSEDNAADYESELTEGAYIVEVLAGTPAEEAELQAGDVVTAVDGDVVDQERTLADRLYAYEPGDVVTLDIVRDGETIQVEVTLGGDVESMQFPFDGFSSFFDAPFFTEPATEPSL